MIVCSCNVISDKEIEDVVTSILDEDQWQLVVPGQVYKIMEKRGHCCGCLPNVLDIIIFVTEKYHRQHNFDAKESVIMLERARALKQKYQRIGRDERPRKSNRAA